MCIFRKAGLIIHCLYGIHHALTYQALLSVPVIFSQSHSHTVNLLSALPLQCLDVLLMVPLEPGSQQCQGVNMDCVHTLVLFMERRLESVRETVICSREAECSAANLKQEFPPKEGLLAHIEIT